jgi:acyl-homoserine-lactone acylase
MQRSHSRRHRFGPRGLGAAALLGVLLGLAGCGGGDDAAAAPEPRYDSEIRWTSHGIPHVRAANWGSLGYGFAYATARDAVCTIARDAVMAQGELSRHFGPGDGRLESDVFHRAVLDEPAVRQFLNRQTDQHTHYFAGYVAGYNRFLRDRRNALPTACRDASWLRELTVDDVARLTLSVAIRYGLGRFQRELANAAPPGSPVTRLETRFDLPVGLGSNAIAMGKAATESGRGLLLGNPHAPWRGSSRFHLIHMTIPGELDVMGVSLYTTNRIDIGFNADVAWTHNVSTGLRSTLYALALDPDRPTRYRHGDGYREMIRRDLEIPVRDATGAIRTERRSVWSTHHGPVLVSDQLAWTTDGAYAIRDANLLNDRMSATYDALNRARSIDEVENALYLQGVSWTSTIAADRHGTAYYADISVTPHVDAALLERCRVVTEPPARLPADVVVLDGADPGCAWLEDPHSAVPGAMPPQRMPRLRRDDFVANANDSHWLTHPAEPLEGYSPTIGPERSGLSLRTRAGLAFVTEALADGARVGPDDLLAMLFSQRNYGAELLLDDLLRLCAGWGHPVELDGATIPIGPACTALRDWNRTETVDSRGGHVWREVWRTAATLPDLWATPFDPADPLGTPRGLAVDDAEVRDALRRALARAVVRLAANGIAPDAMLGAIQFEERNGERIPIPGGEDFAGMWSLTHSELGPGGYTPVTYGNSWIQVVGWNSDGSIDARGLLTHSQSEDPASPHHADQTRLYAEGRWLRLPFREEDILADPNLQTLRLSE